MLWVANDQESGEIAVVVFHIFGDGFQAKELSSTPAGDGRSALCLVFHYPTGALGRVMAFDGFEMGVQVQKAGALQKGHRM